MQARIPLILSAVILPLAACCAPMEPTKSAKSTPAPTAQSTPAAPINQPAPSTPAVVSVPMVQHGFVLVDNFEGYAAGADILGKNGWATGSSKSAAGVFTAQVDPTNPANKTLRIDKLADDSRFRAVNNSAAIVIAPKTTATVFFRVRTEGDKAVDMSFGHGDAQAEAFGGKPAYGDHRIQYVLHAREQEVRGGDGSAVDGITASELAPATWYSLWFVVNNTARTYDVYIQGGAYAAQTKVAMGVPFRATADIKADQPLDRFFITVDDDSPGKAFLDDLCIDRAKQNLANPLSN